MSQTAFLIYVIYLCLYNVKSHSSQKVLNLSYGWFLMKNEEMRENRVGTGALQCGRMAGERTVSHPHRFRLTGGRLQNAFMRLNV